MNIRYDWEPFDPTSWRPRSEHGVDRGPNERECFVAYQIGGDDFRFTFNCSSAEMLLAKCRLLEATDARLVRCRVSMPGEWLR
jgi:hypothetical protein